MNSVMLPGPVMTVVVVVSCCALAYIWLGCLCEAQGRGIKALESEQMALKEEQTNEEGKWAVTKSVPNLEAALRRHGIAMSAPRPAQTVRLQGRFYEGWIGNAGNGASVARLEGQGPRHE
jgi:hypothetical protein